MCHVHTLSLSLHRGLTDTRLIQLLSHAPHLTALDVHQTPITDAVVDTLMTRPFQQLWLSVTCITSAGMIRLCTPLMQQPLPFLVISS